MRTLLFGTTYVDTVEKMMTLQWWMRLAQRNARCDVMLVDSASTIYPYVPLSIKFHSFPDNVGHLSRGGADGFGRAFCRGLQYAIDENYDYVAHVEGDSLCKLNITAEIENMELRGDGVATIHVSSMPKWPETGLMFFSVDWLRDSNFVARYDWENRPRRPEPEYHVGQIVGDDMAYLDVRGMRDDFHELTIENLADRKLDWLTHASLDVMHKFAAAA
jgi:hypothetical protein